MIRIDNVGPRITGTDYFDSEHARRGMAYLSANAGALRLLLPERGWLDEMRGAEYAIITRGEWTPELVRQPDGSRRVQHPRDAIELLFEDHTDSPMAMHLVVEQVDRMPVRADEGRTDLQLLVYTAGPTLEMELPARYRRARRLPHLKPWGER